MERKLKRGDIYSANLIRGVGSEQNGLRPVLIVQNDTGNTHGNTVVVAAITSKTERKYIMPTHCRIQAMYGLPPHFVYSAGAVTYHRQSAARYVYRNAERQAHA